MGFVDWKGTSVSVRVVSAERMNETRILIRCIIGFSREATTQPGMFGLPGFFF